MTDEAAEEIAELVEDLATAETELIEPDDLFASVLAAAEGSDEATTQGRRDLTVEPYEPPPYDVLLRVMGEPRAEGVDLTADETELLALLVCLRHRTEIHIGLIHESVGPERARKTIENRMSILRRKLGVGSDGLDLLPEAAPGTTAAATTSSVHSSSPTSTSSNTVSRSRKRSRPVRRWPC